MTLSSSAPQELSLQKTPCLICEKPDDEILFPRRFTGEDINPHSFSARRKRKIIHYETVKCRRCHLVRAKEVLTENIARDLYENSGVLYTSLHPQIAKTYLNLICPIFEKYQISKTDKVLEIGCGDGLVLNQLYTLGYKDIHGVEPSREACKLASPNIRHQIVNSTFDASLFPANSISAVLNFHVIDHLYDPKKFILDAWNLLRSGGLLITVCHDVSSWSAKILGHRSPIFDIEHVYLFDIETLSALLRKCHFDILDSGQLTNQYPISYWMSLLPGVSEYSSILPNFIGNINLSIKAGNLYLVARKP